MGWSLCIALVLAVVLGCRPAPPTLAEVLAGPPEEAQAWILTAARQDPAALRQQLHALPDAQQVVVIELLASADHALLADLEPSSDTARQHWQRMISRPHLGHQQTITTHHRPQTQRPWLPADPGPHQLNGAALPAWIRDGVVGTADCAGRVDAAHCVRQQALPLAEAGDEASLVAAVQICRASPALADRQECFFQIAEAHFAPTAPQRVSRAYSLCLACLDPDRPTAPDPGSDITFAQGCLYHLRDRFLASTAPWSALQPSLSLAEQTLTLQVRQRGVSERLVAGVIDAQVRRTPGGLEGAQREHLLASIAARLVEEGALSPSLPQLSVQVLDVMGGAAMPAAEARRSAAPYPDAGGEPVVPWLAVWPQEGSLRRLSWRGAALDTRATVSDVDADARICVLEALMRLRPAASDGPTGFAALDAQARADVQRLLVEGLSDPEPAVQWTAARGLRWLGLSADPPEALSALAGQRLRGAASSSGR